MIGLRGKELSLQIILHSKISLEKQNLRGKGFLDSIESFTMELDSSKY